MIKQIVFSLFFAVLATASVQAQRIAYIDLNRILESMTEYKNAQAQLDKLANKWRQDINQEYDQIKGMYNRYQAEQVLMSEEARTQKEEEIMNKERQVREMQKDKFGPEGALFRKRQELVRPIQDKVYEAIEQYAASKGFDFVFDKSSNVGMIYSNERFDKTEDIMKQLGVK